LGLAGAKGQDDDSKLATVLDRLFPPAVSVCWLFGHDATSDCAVATLMPAEGSCRDGRSDRLWTLARKFRISPRC
jgi:hypothetical protein